MKLQEKTRRHIRDIKKLEKIFGKQKMKNTVKRKFIFPLDVEDDSSIIRWEIGENAFITLSDGHSKTVSFDAPFVYKEDLEDQFVEEKRQHIAYFSTLKTVINEALDEILQSIESRTKDSYIK